MRGRLPEVSISIQPPLRIALSLILRDSRITRGFGMDCLAQRYSLKFWLRYILRRRLKLPAVCSVENLPLLAGLQSCVGGSRIYLKSNRTIAITFAISTS